MLIRRDQLECLGHESTVDDLARHMGLSNGIAKAVGTVGVAVVIDAGPINEVRGSIDSHCQIAALARHIELALPARGIHDSNSFRRADPATLGRS